MADRRLRQPGHFRTIPHPLRLNTSDPAEWRLDRVGATTGSGCRRISGAEDEVDNHWKELLGAAALSTLLSVGTEVNSGTDLNDNNTTIITALRPGAEIP